MGGSGYKARNRVGQGHAVKGCGVAQHQVIVTCFDDKGMDIGPTVCPGAACTCADDVGANDRARLFKLEPGSQHLQLGAADLDHRPWLFASANDYHRTETVVEIERAITIVAAFLTLRLKLSPAKVK
jgi:hypothetical protein